MMEGFVARWRPRHGDDSKPITIKVCDLIRDSAILIDNLLTAFTKLSLLIPSDAFETVRTRFLTVLEKDEAMKFGNLDLVVTQIQQNFQVKPPSSVQQATQQMWEIASRVWIWLAELIKSKSDGIAHARRIEHAEQVAKERQTLVGSLSSAIYSDIEAMGDARRQASVILESTDFSSMEFESDKYIQDATSHAVGTLRKHISISVPQGMEQGPEIWRKASQSSLCSELAGMRSALASSGVHTDDSVGVLYVLDFASCVREHYAKTIGDALLRDLRPTDMVFVILPEHPSTITPLHLLHRRFLDNLFPNLDIVMLKQLPLTFRPRAGEREPQKCVMSYLVRLMAPSLMAEGSSPAKRRRVLFQPAASNWNMSQLWNLVSLTELNSPTKGCRTTFINKSAVDPEDSEDEKAPVGDNPQSQSQDEHFQNSELAPRALPELTTRTDPFELVSMRNLSPTQRLGQYGVDFAEDILRKALFHKSGAPVWGHMIIVCPRVSIGDWPLAAFNLCVTPEYKFSPNGFTFCGSDADASYANYSLSRFREHSRKAFIKGLLIEGQLSYEELVGSAMSTLGNKHAQLQEVWERCTRLLKIFSLAPSSSDVSCPRQFVFRTLAELCESYSVDAASMADAFAGIPEGFFEDWKDQCNPCEVAPAASMTEAVGSLSTDSVLSGGVAHHNLELRSSGPQDDALRCLYVKSTKSSKVQIKKHDILWVSSGNTGHFTKARLEGVPCIPFKLIANNTVVFQNASGQRQVSTVLKLLEKGIIAAGISAALRCCPPRISTMGASRPPGLPHSDRTPHRISTRRHYPLPESPCSFADQSNNNSGGAGCLKDHIVTKHNERKWTVRKGTGMKKP
jgi:hypothetical protein